MKGTAAYIHLTGTLLRAPPPSKVLVICFVGAGVLLAQADGRARLPTARFEPAEDLERTVRRELFYTTGAFLSASEQLGVLCFKTGTLVRGTPIYLGRIDRIERPVLRGEGPLVVPIDELSQHLTDWYWNKTLSFLLHHAHQLHKRQP